MKAVNGRGTINVWQPTDLHQLELHRGIAVARPVPRHWHEQYQFCFLEAGAGDVTYRGDSFFTPPASLFIVHPGEIHSNRCFDPSGCSYRTLFIEPDLMRRTIAEAFGRDRGIPFFSTTVIFDKDVLALFRALHIALETEASTLERESLLNTFSIHLIERYGEQRFSLDSLKGKPIGIKRACEYLIEHYAENVVLEQLARVVGLSRFHFNRVFSEQIGMPPHAFQTQVRVARARAFLLEGWSICEVAALTGFADQSHLTRHFKRLVGVTPGRYQQNSKNVQDTQGL